ncbi:MAG: thiamine-phosphate kinase [Candidatus Ratteibacteria bacterium]
MNEDHLVLMIEEMIGSRGIRHKESVAGIGDDCAVVKKGKGFLLLTTDVVVEGVHFDDSASLRGVGWKALAANISDIAAMAGLPKWALVSFGLPDGNPDRVKTLYQGILDVAEKFGVEVIGGNITSSATLFVDIFLLGESAGIAPVMRCGASLGDALFVTGFLGGSRAGREFSFIPRVKEARRLCKKVSVSAMMDISDGLSTDLRRLCLASNTGFDLEADRIPISPEAIAHTRSSQDALMAALSDGEDYELLFTVPSSEAEKVPSCIVGTKVSYIGKITEAGRYTASFEGNSFLVEPKGWFHFSSSRNR